MTWPRAGRLARLLFAVALTALLFWRSDPAEVTRAAASARPAPLLGALVLMSVDRALMAGRWVMLLRPFRGAGAPPIVAVIRIFFVSTFVGTFLPSVGGDAVRAYALARQGVAGPVALASVLMDRVLGVLSMVVMATAGLVVVRQLASSPAVLVALVGTVAGCGLAVAVVFSSRAEATARRVASLIPGPWAPVLRGLGRLWTAMQTYSTRRVELLIVLAASLAVQTLRVLQAYLLGASLGVEQPLMVYFAFVPLILLVMQLPITVSGLGTSQAAFVWCFGQVSVPDATAFALSILFVALGPIGNLPGGLLYTSGGLHGSSQTPSPPGATPAGS
ncbi:MAG: lysylphosphatidylglycerol synthase transmembrane domain-containing protein [Acidobacteriota bacterium]